MAFITKKSGQKVSKRLYRFSRRAKATSIDSIESNLISRRSHFISAKPFIIEWILLVLVITFLAITQSSWYADSYSLSGYTSGGTFIEATLGKVSSLNPLFASTNSEIAISRLLFVGLTTNDYSGHSGLGLADSINVSDDGKVYTVHLRDGLKWSDGEPITPDDVIFTTEILQNSSLTTSYSANLSRVSVTLDDSDNIIFTLPTAYSDFMSALNFPILPKHILQDVDPAQLIDSDFSKNPVSSGPFMFNASQSVGSSGEVVVYLSANPHYYKNSPLLDSFAIHAYLDKDSIISALNSGTVTATAELSASDKSSITSEKIYLRESSLNTGVFAFFNTSSGIFKEKSLRSAVRTGVNISQVREVAGSVKSLDYPILDSQVDELTWPTVPSYDKNSALSSLEGYDLSTQVEIATVSSGNLPAVTESFASELRDLGFTVNVSIYEENQEFISNIIRNRAYDILIYDIDLGSTPDLLAYYHSSQATSSGYNLSNYKNIYVDDLILSARTSSDASYRRTKYEKFLEYWVEDIPAIGLYQSNLAYFYNKNVQIFSENISLNVAADRFVEVEYWSSEKTVLNRTP